MIKIKNGNIQSSPCFIGRIDAIAYDGYEFALLTPNQKAIVKLNQQLCPIKTLPTCRKYHCLCFNERSHCYWAMSVQRPCTLFMLDELFREVDTLKLPSTESNQPCAISCSPCSDVLMMLYPNTILSVDICSRGYHFIPIEQKDIHVFDILSLMDGFVLAYLQDHQFFIEVNCNDFENSSRFCIPDGFRLEGMYLCDFTQTSDGSIYEVNLLLSDSKNHEQCILPLQLTCCKEDHDCCEEECCGKEECGCCEDNTSCLCGVYEILHSIALEEAGLAHILNAEGEKIQKAVASNATIEELLRVNASVSNTINKVTVLEGQLIAKLENVLCFCDQEEACCCFDDCESHAQE